jgi:hypothetical protein
MSSRKAIGFLLTGLNTLACSCFGNYVFFLLQQEHGFGNRENLLTCALHGLLYVRQHGSADASPSGTGRRRR